MTRELRSEAVQEERRARRSTDLDKSSRDRLAIPAEWFEPGGPCDRNKWHVRWINDDAGRMQQMTVEKDYDVITFPDPESKEEQAYRRVAGRNVDGTPQYTYLCRVYRDWFEADQKRKSANVQQNENAMMTDPTPASEDNRSPDTAYAVKGNRIQRGYTP